VVSFFGSLILAWASTPVVFLSDSLQYFSATAQSHLSSMFCHRLIGGIEDGFCKRKFEHDLAFIVRHFENRI